MHVGALVCFLGWTKEGVKLNRPGFHGQLTPIRHFEKVTVALARARTQMDAAVKSAKARLELSINRPGLNVRFDSFLDETAPVDPSYILTG